MKVKELIEKVSALDGEMEVRAILPYEDYCTVCDELNQVEVDEDDGLPVCFLRDSKPRPASDFCSICGEELTEQ